MEESLTEYSLLLISARTKIESEHLAQIQIYSESGFSWKKLLTLAAYHGVSPLVENSIISHRSEYGTPDEIANVVVNRKRNVLVRNTFLASENARVCKVLSEKGVRVLTLKGAALAQSAYGGIQNRSFSDLDILISKSDFPEARDILASEGYLPFTKLREMGRLHEKLYLWQSRQYQFSRARGMFNLDLHLDLMPPLFSFPITFNKLYERKEIIRIENGDLPTFGHLDMLLILCFHCVKNRWERLKHMVDIAELIQSHPDLDWTMVLETASRLRCERILAISLAITRATVGVTAPEEVWEMVDSFPEIAEIADRAAREMPYRMSIGVASFGARFRDNLTVLDTRVARLRYMGVAIVRRLSDIFSPEPS